MNHVNILVRTDERTDMKIYEKKDYAMVKLA